MEVTIEEISSLTRKLTIVLPPEKVRPELEAGYRKLKNEVRLKGFRRGKVPRHILEKNYSPQIKAEVSEKLVQATYFEAIEQQKLDPVVHPEIKRHSFGDDDSFTYEAEVDIRPDFELGQYKGIAIEKPETTVSDAEVTEELERLRKQMAPLRNVEGRGVAVNDLAIIDFQGFHDGEPIKQVRGEQVTMDVGSGRNGKEFEDKLIGLTKGEETSIEIDFPADNQNPLLAGKKIEFKIKLRDIQERVPAEIDDEFAKDVSEEFNTLDELKNQIRQQKQEEKEKALEGDISDRLMQKLVEGHDFDIPERLIQYEIEDYIKQAEENLKRSGLTLESAGLNRDEMGQHYREAAKKRVCGDFILKKISEQEGIKIDDDDINRGFGRIAEQYNMKVAEVKEYFKHRDDMLPFLNELLNEKILQFLRDEATFVAPAGHDASAPAEEQAQ